jgi:hypothetical protein
MKVPHDFESIHQKAKLSISLNKLVFLTFLFVIFYFGYEKYAAHQTEQAEASVLILSPKVNDIYFLDLWLDDGEIERKNKYKLAKVVRVSDEGVGIVYGRVFYQWQSAVVSSIKYGELSNHDYFKLIPDYIPFSKIKEMKSNGTIYLVKRPIRDKLYGNFVNLE